MASGDSAVQCAAYLIVQFLDAQQEKVDEGVRESIAVARECIASSFNVTEDAEKTLSEMVGNSTLLSLVESISTVKDKVADLKAKGNELMKNEKFQEASECYTEAIKYAPNNAILYCNRAAAYSRLGKFDTSVNDCRAAIGLDPNYAKAWGRLGTSLSSMGSHIEAAEAFKTASEIEPNIAAWKENYEKEKNAAGGPAGAAGAPLGNSSPNFLMNLMQSPHMMQMAQQMMSDPNMTNMMQNVLSGGGGGSAGGMPQNMDSIMQMAQSFASQMENQNPDLINRLRNQYGSGSSGGQGGQGNQDGQPPPGSL